MGGIDERLTIGQNKVEIQEPVAKRWRMSDDPTKYRGVLPESKLILNSKGFKYFMNTKRRINGKRTVTTVWTV